MQNEIVLPETKPETEWIDGRPVQKVSPTYDHGLLQRRLATAVGGWADATGNGRVATEWRFRVSPPGDVIRPLVPDVSYLSYAAFPKSTARRDLATPLGAPTVAFEILSPDDRPRNVESKICTLLAAGAEAVVVIDPRRGTAIVHDAAAVTVFQQPEILTHPALPGFALDLERFFADME